MSLELIIRSILLGAGLAMDAFSVSLADGLGERDLSAARVFTIAGTFAAFQFVMPVAGWLLVHTAAEQFRGFQRFIPWIALLLLLFIGGKMLIEGIRDKHSTDDIPDKAEKLSGGELLLQGIATSIDALSVGFTIAAYSALTAVMSSLIIGGVTLIICIAGLYIGRRIGTRLSGSASILGGIILIAIGIEIWVSGIL